MASDAAGYAPLDPSEEAPLDHSVEAPPEPAAARRSGKSLWQKAGAPQGGRAGVGARGRKTKALWERALQGAQEQLVQGRLGKLKGLVRREIIATLSSVDAFADLPPETLVSLVEDMSFRRYAKDEVIIQKRQPAAGLFEGPRN